MKSKALYIIIFFIFLKAPAQSKRVKITGSVTSDSLNIENVHIINLTSKKQL